MNIVNFKESNSVFKTEHDGIKFHYYYDPNSGQIITKWKLSFLDWIRILFTRRIWLSLITDTQYLPPMGLISKHPFEKEDK